MKNIACYNMVQAHRMDIVTRPITVISSEVIFVINNTFGKRKKFAENSQLAFHHYDKIPTKWSLYWLIVLYKRRITEFFGVSFHTGYFLHIETY